MSEQPGSETPNSKSPDSNPSDLYQILNLSPQATLLDIKKAFRRLARQYHPDLNPNSAAAARFKQISAAYELLSDRQRRQPYDESHETESPSAKPQNAQMFYQRGLDQLALRNYSEAITAFSQAIEINPEFTEAYLSRCRANEELKDNRAVLDDCYRLLQINPQFAQAYYYQGRARYRLGYQQSAVEVYTHAITLQNTYALAYFQRGRIFLELKDIDRARQDLQQASHLFRVQDDLEQYRQTEAILQRFESCRRSTRFKNGLPRILTEAIGNIPGLLFNPSANLQPTFARLGPTKAVWAGMLYGGATAACAVFSGALLERSWSTHSLIWAVAVGRFYGALVVAGAVALKVTRGRFHWSEVCFLTGLATFPLAGWTLLRVLSALPWFGLAVLGLAGCYCAILLYIGYTQLTKMAESTILAIVPLMLLLSAAALFSLH